MQTLEAERWYAGWITALEDGSVLTETHATMTGLPHTRAAITGAMIETG